MKHIIIGGVAGGATAAARIRRADREARDRPTRKRQIHSRYANCGLPYYIGGAIAEREKLFFTGPRLRSADDSISTCGSKTRR